MNKFQTWWHNVGSGIVPLKGHDYEQHAERICGLFYEHINNPCTRCMAYLNDKKGKTEYCINLCYDNKSALPDHG